MTNPEASQTSATQIDADSTKIFAKKSMNRFLTATFAIALTAAFAGISMTPTFSATAATMDYRALGFESAVEMQKYFTVTSTQVREIPTSPAVMHKVLDVTVNVGPVVIGNGNTVDPGAPRTGAPVATPSPAAPQGPRPPFEAPGANVPTPGASAAPSPSPSATPAKPSINIQVPGTGGSIGGIDPAQIMPWIALGEKIWALIAANKPVVSVQTKRAFVLPVAEQDWKQMENWKGPAAHTYRLEYRNGFGSTVIAHTYTIAYNFGGTYNEQGQFLANLTVIPSRVEVAWGYTLNTSVELGDAVNTGSKASPVPGIEIQIISKVDTVLKHAETRDGFFVKGSGEIQQLTSPNATLVP